ncbi:MAG: hypothetical protein P1V97_07560 [Planctomycetota bacterium]|nr:hypothetical protein [Planctomycetota bacterium]
MVRFKLQTLTMCLSFACLLGPLSSNASAVTIAAKVTAISDESIILDKGRASGIEPRMVFDVYSDALVVKLPLNGDKEPVYIKQTVIARVIVRAVNTNTSRAAIYGSPKKALKVGYFALYNPTQKAENQSPFVASISPAPKSAYSWRERVNIKLTIINEPEDDMYFEWICRSMPNDDKSEGAFEGGVLVSKRTRVPENTWICPPQKGNYRVQVTIYDTAGKRATEKIDLVSTGINPTKKLGANLKYRGVFCETNLFQNVRDVTFDDKGRMYVLQGGSGSFVGGTSPSIKVFKANGQLTESADLPSAHKDCSRLAFSERYLFLLDPENKVVKRFRLSTGSMASTLSSRVYQFGRSGVGNGKFSKPVDMCIDSNSQICILDFQQSAIQVFKESGTFLFSMGMEGTDVGQMRRPVALASDPNGRLFCLDDGRKKVLVFKGGRFESEFSCGSRGKLTGIAYDPYKDSLGIVDLEDGVIQRYSMKTEKYTTLKFAWSGTQPSMVKLMKITESGMLRSDGQSGFVVVDREGSSLGLFSALTTTNDPGFLGRMGGVKVEGSTKVAGAPKGDLLVLNTSSKMLTRVTRKGWINLRLGGGDSKGFLFNTPVDVAVSDTGSIYVLDAKLSQVHQFNSVGYPLKSKLGSPGTRQSQLTECLDMDCSGLRKQLTILQDRKSHNMHQMGFNGKGQAWPAIATIDDPVVGCQGIDGKFWIIDDDVLVSIPPGGAASPTSYKFDKITDMTTGIDGHFYIVDVDDGYISVHRANGAQTIKKKIEFKKISEPRDIGLDNYGRMYVFDENSGKIHLLSD